MGILIAFLAGVAVSAVGFYFVARNNRKRFAALLDLDPKAKWKEILAKLREKLRKKF